MKGKVELMQNKGQWDPKTKIYFVPASAPYRSM